MIGHIREKTTQAAVLRGLDALDGIQEEALSTESLQALYEDLRTACAFEHSVLERRGALGLRGFCRCGHSTIDGSGRTHCGRLDALEEDHSASEWLALARGLAADLRASAQRRSLAPAGPGFVESEGWRLALPGKAPLPVRGVEVGGHFVRAEVTLDGRTLTAEATVTQGAFSVLAEKLARHGHRGALLGPGEATADEALDWLLGVSSEGALVPTADQRLALVARLDHAAAGRREAEPELATLLARLAEALRATPGLRSGNPARVDRWRRNVSIPEVP